MTRRNDPCPCNSGKKYKACCLKKENIISIDEELNKDLEQVLLNFFHAHPTKKETNEIYEWIGDREEYLSDRFDNDKVSAIMGDCYYFNHRVDIWQMHLERESAKSKRPRVQTVLEGWMNPNIILGTILQISNNSAEVVDVFSEEKVMIEIPNPFEGGVGDFIFGHFLLDSRQQERYYKLLNSLIVFPAKDEALVERVKALYTNSKSESVLDFYNKYIIECYVILGDKETSIEELFSEEELELISILHSSLVEMDTKSDKLMYIFIEYIQRKGIPKGIKKPTALVAGVLQFGMLNSIISYIWTKKEISSFLEVSTTTANKYEELFKEFYEHEISKEELTQNTVFAFEVGTDANLVEFSNWKMGMHLSKVSIKNEKEMSRYIDIYKDKEFNPVNDKEASQKYAYEAYISRDLIERERLTSLAFELDPQNIDAILLKVDNELERSVFFEEAISIGEKQFDPNFESVWGYLPNRPYLRALFKYGLWCFEQKMFKEAFNLFNKILQLNPSDNQGVRYPSVATLIALNRLEEAESLMSHYQDSDNAFFSWFRWAMEKKKSFFSKETQDAYDLASEDNAYVANYYRMKAPALAYPHSMAITPDSPEEGKVIWTLLQPII
ncbi:SEC-C metal-binding domain-containing protein [Psychrobacillus psychrodurans]|uniref:SEC-C metal-binding domain-containing protein n=1 Tax=Psychrobacillus psychrodurans TaxID=126157 RepID=UPI0008E5F91A|nr:SEC-C metal-binding domain-containing protein [Psychrobacillus psychrodurans]MCZ8539999.1 SEC-C metal-binding domain-containing protein [Psychrobacillus psychrodurans]SFM52454.1 Tetratricopeptide repeat-containing protein [Psychrobacillus psychrodurans]